MDIYPAREEPIEGVTSSLIYDKVIANAKIMIQKESLLDLLETKEFDVVATIGAGDIDQLVQPMKEQLERRYHVG